MGTRASAGRGRAKPSGGGIRFVVKCLGVNSLLRRQARFPLTLRVAGERAAEASFGIGESRQENSDGGTGDGPRSRGIVSLRAVCVFRPRQRGHFGKICSARTRIVNRFHPFVSFLDCAQHSALAGCSAMPTMRFLPTTHRRSMAQGEIPGVLAAWQRFCLGGLPRGLPGLRGEAGDCSLQSVFLTYLP